MRLRTALLTVFLVVNIALAGCANLSGEQTTTAEPTTTVTTTQTTTETFVIPEKGDDLLTVSKSNSTTAEEVSASARANFSELNETQQEVFLQALECNCSVNQDIYQDAFEYTDRNRIEYVHYEGQWYYLRVAIG